MFAEKVWMFFTESAGVYCLTHPPVPGWKLAPLSKTPTAVKRDPLVRRGRGSIYHEGFTFMTHFQSECITLSSHSYEYLLIHIEDRKY